MAAKTALISVLALLLLLTGAAADSRYDELSRQAEGFYAEKSFSRAHEVYEQIAKLELTPAQRRWVTFRLADTQWRGSTDLREAIATLNELASGRERDVVFAEAHESLGDFHVGHHGDWFTHYSAALDWWAGSDDLELARRRYLNIVWKLERRSGYNVARDALVNAVKIAQTTEDRAHARYLLALQLLLTERHNAPSVERALELFEEVITEGATTEWYDEALHYYASTTTDYDKALAYYDLLLSKFTRSTSPYHDDAQRAVDQIRRPSVDVMVSQTFLPDAEQELTLSWRNVKQIAVSIHAADLTAEAPLDESDRWLESHPLGATVRSFTHETNDTGKHEPGSVLLPLTPRLPAGAYIVTVAGGGDSARALLLVTDAHVLVHTANQRLHIYVSDVETGEPIANARVRVITAGRDRASHMARTNAEGLADVEVKTSSTVTITANAGSARQAWHQAWAHSYHSRGNAPQWRVYAFTDRPAYRPEETVQWKMIARVRESERWTTPSNASLTYEITGPRGEKVANGTAKLNAFGSFWGELPLTPTMALGMYTITFRDGQRHTGRAQLFRLEEYKLPEFLVTVKTNEERQYRLGDVIEATVDASYYFGGPVANAEVEVVVHQQPFHRYWYPWRHYDWYWPAPPQYQHESIVTRETLRTDAEGRAIVRIPTQRDGTDTSYRIEARVVDASRREVRGEGTVRVTKHRYTVLAQPEHYLHRPGDSVSVLFKAVDANERPVQTTGTVTVTRRRWNKSVYAEEQVTTTKLTTNAQGEATFTFTPHQPGYYAIEWTSFDGDASREQNRITAETTVWVADRNATDIGYYHSGGVDILVDKEAVRAGETVPVMIATGTSGRWVVLTTSADEILDTRVLRLDGNVKLVQLQIDDRHVPNFFLTASSVYDLGMQTDSEQIVVPPVEHFVNVDVKSDRAQYEPRQEGTLTITTKDVDGRPVPAEVALSVSDEAVTAIQQDPAGDPRQFFYGELRHSRVQVTGGVHSQRYEGAMEEGEETSAEGGIVGGVAGGVAGGVIGGYATDAVQESITVTAAAPQMRLESAPPPAPVPPPVAVAPTEAKAAGAGGIDVQVRSDFRSTAFWKPDVVTDASGVATVKITFPEALTTWRATARAVTTASSFGIGSSTAKTNLPLLVRLQGPRFFVAGDRVVVSGVVNNNTDEPITVTPALEVEGLTLQSKAEAVRVEAHGEARVDWTVLAERAGEAKLRVSARGPQFGDAMERTFVVYEHGIDKLIARSGKMRGNETLVKLELPRERRATDLTVQVAPTLAVAMLDALPYLLEFPYGCTEQTMSRFLPAAIVARTLTKLGLDPHERLPKKQLDAVTAAGMTRLYDMQHPTGAWGWWKEGADDAFMTAYVIWGFALAREGGLPVRTNAVDRAASWLAEQLVSFERDPQSQAWMLHALSAWRKPGAPEQRALENVWKHRERLTPYGRALFALAAHRYGDVEKTRVLVRNLEDGVKLERGDDAAETMATARWGSEQRYWWRWYDSPVETTAFVLQALVTIDPQHRLIEPAMNWLVKNRRGAAWSNTRDTAIALLALNDYLVRSGELQGDVSYELTVNGRVIASKTIAQADVLRAPSRFPVDPAILNDVTQEVRIRRTAGNGPIYFAAEARFVSLEEPVTAASSELAVKREYFRLAPRPTLLKGVLYDRVPLRDGDSVQSGERIEVLATVDAKNDYSYLLFEDLKPGGFEAVELQSGQSLFATNKENGSVWVYQELRDRKVAMFIDKLPQGQWEIRYTLRAETPGSFHALPLIGQAMYAPEIRGNGDEVRVTVRD
ncbi:MAG TPA: MG2 domain-containing protein [Thermoanaerobaculia bacterium]|nr:MG2 domain-containing protein [Thermoanaerobaculia bacterium]